MDMFINLTHHGNLMYDRFKLKDMLRAFINIYDRVLSWYIIDNDLKGSIEFNGVSVLLLKEFAPTIIDKIKYGIKRGNIEIIGTFYSAPLCYFNLEDSQFYNIKLGKEIIERVFKVKLEGFFPQESVYHPDLPYLLRKVGYKWIGLHYNQLKSREPVIIEGIDSEIIGVPYYLSPIDPNFSISELIYKKLHKDGFYAFIGDFELTPNLINLKWHISRGKNKNNDIEYIFISDYLKEASIEKILKLGPCGYFDFNEFGFTRWTGQPINYNWLALMLRGEKIFENLETISEKKKIKFPNQIPELLKPELLDIEYSELLENKILELLDKNQIYCKALHYLVWGSNSDAAGWYPWKLKQDERKRSLKNAIIIFEKICKLNKIKCFKKFDKVKSNLYYFSIKSHQKANDRLQIHDKNGNIIIEELFLLWGNKNNKEWESRPNFILNNDSSIKFELDLKDYGYMGDIYFIDDNKICIKIIFNFYKPMEFGDKFNYDDTKPWDVKKGLNLIIKPSFNIKNIDIGLVRKNSSYKFPVRRDITISSPRYIKYIGDSHQLKIMSYSGHIVHNYFQDKGIGIFLGANTPKISEDPAGTNLNKIVNTAPYLLIYNFYRLMKKIPFIPIFTPSIPAKFYGKYKVILQVEII